MHTTSSSVKHNSYVWVVNVLKLELIEYKIKICIVNIEIESSIENNFYIMIIQHNMMMWLHWNYYLIMWNDDIYN